MVWYADGLQDKKHFVIKSKRIPLRNQKWLFVDKVLEDSLGLTKSSHKIKSIYESFRDEWIFPSVPLSFIYFGWPLKWKSSYKRSGRVLFIELQRFNLTRRWDRPLQSIPSGPRRFRVTSNSIKQEIFLVSGSENFGGEDTNFDQEENVNPTK